jgi:malate/lactate dehydrogenase
MIAFDENIPIASSVYRKEFDLCIGTVVTIGNDGITDFIPVVLSDETKNKYNASVEAVRNVNSAL